MNEITLEELNQKIEMINLAGMYTAQGGKILVEEVIRDRAKIEQLQAEVAELKSTKKFLGEAVHLLLAREFGNDYRETSGLFD